MYQNLSDETVFTVTKVLYTEFEDEEKQTRLDPNNLRDFKANYIKPLYPHKEVKEGGHVRMEKYSCGEYCCELDTGSFFCYNAKPPGSEHKDLGLGICLYVNFLKHLTGLLFFVSVFAVFSVAIYYFIAYQVEYPLFETYQDFITGSTIGVISSSYSKCQYANLANNTSKFSLSCPSSGKINLLGPVFTNQTLNSIHLCRIENRKFIDDRLVPIHSLQTDCDDSGQQCNVQVSVTSSTHKSFDYKFLSFVYQCQQSMYQLGSVQFDDSIALYFTIAIDLVILIAFLFFLSSEKQCEEDQEEYFKLFQLAINDFTVKIKGFKSNHFQKEINDLIRSNSNKKWAEKIVQIKVPETEQLRDSIQKRREKYLKLYQLIDSSFFEENVNVKKYQTHKQFIAKCYNSTEAEEYKKYKSKLELALSEFNQQHQLQLSGLKTKDVPIEAYFTLESPNIKIDLIKNSEQSCFSRYLRAGERRYEICEPPFADMIIWENKSKFTLLRVLLVWILTLLICFGSYMLVGFALYKQTELKVDNNFDQDCTLLYNTADLKEFDEGKSSQKAYIDCYCKTQLFSLSFDQDQCQKWIYSYSIYRSTPLLISLGIVIYNLALSRLFKAMTKLQAHSYVTSELYSYIMKRSFLLVMNMGLIMILLNINYRGSWDNQDFNFLFQGDFDDITTDWYNSIGAAITLTLSFNIFLPILEMVLLSLLRCMRRCWDRRCCMRTTSKKTKKQYLALYADDLFPIEERYADLLSIIAIVLAFSTVMPVLYVIGFLSFAFMMLSDKVLLFRVYQKPLNYSSYLQSKVIKTVFVLLVVHCVTAMLFISEPSLVKAGQQSQFTKINTGVKRLNPVVQLPYILPYVIIMFLLVIWALFKVTIIRFMEYCAEKCVKKPLHSFQSSKKRHTNFYESLSRYQISRLKLSLQKQISSSHTHDPATTTEMQMNSQEIKNQTQSVAEKTLARLEQCEQQYDPANKINGVKLIGRAGYEEMFDDQALYRQRKIRSLSEELNRIIRQSSLQSKQRENHGLIAETEIQISFN